MIDTQHLRELMAKATPGPLHRVDYGIVPEWAQKEPGSLQDWSLIRLNDDWCGSTEEQEATINLFVAAVNSLPAMLDEIERLRKENAELKADTLDIPLLPPITLGPFPCMVRPAQTRPELDWETP